MASRPRFTVTRWRSLRDTTVARASEVYWPAFVRWMMLPRAAHEGDAQPGWSAAVFDPPRRAAAHVRAVSLLVLDCDAGDPIEQAWRCWRDYLAALVTSRRHTPEHPRYRIVVALSRSVSPAEHAALWTWAAARCAEHGVRLDPAARDPSRFWFVPAGQPQVIECAGSPIDVDEILERQAIQSAEAEAEAEMAARRVREGGEGGQLPAARGDGRSYGQAALTAECEAVAATAPGSRNARLNTAAYKLGQLVAGSEVSEGEALAALAMSAHRCGLPATEAKRTIQSGLRAGARSPRRAPELPARRETGRPAGAPRVVGEVVAPAGPAAPIALLGGAELAEPLPALAYLVRGIGLVAGGGAPHLVAGYGFSGKTLGCQALLLALAAGQPVWGAYPCEARRVAHIDLEQGRRLTARRYQRLAVAMGVDLAGLGERLAAAVMPRLGLARGDAAAWREIMAGRDLLVLDSLRAATPGADENASTIRAGLDMLGELSETTGCRALAIVHQRKPSPDSAGGQFAIRGSSAIYDAADCVYLHSAEQGEPVRVTQAKARSVGELADPWALVIEDVAGDDGDPRAGLRVVARGAELADEARAAAAEVARAGRAAADAEAIRRALRGHPGGLNTSALRGLAGLSGSRFAAAAAALGGELERVPGAGRAVLHRLATGGPW